MINIVPIVGWLVDLLIKCSISVPFYVVWTICGIGEKYFYFLPKVYQAPSFWNCVGLFIVLPILKMVLTPRFVRVEQKNNSK